AINFIGRKYASMMVGGVLCIIDLSRARERIMFDRYYTMLLGGKSVSQQLLFPERLTLSDGEYSLLEELTVDFAALGFDIDMMGGGVIEVRGIPADISAESIDNTLFQLLQTMALPHQVEDIRREQLALTLAQSQIGRTTLYTQADAEVIAEQLMACSNNKLTPSSKPIMTYITLDDIQQKLA
ncbi:MAG: DNA mismatch repair protein MutL, partial [Alistipes sp.]|nr:DNA mismatch repair protein MutL [Alistipes sp.]